MLGGITAPCTKLRSLRLTLPYLRNPLCAGVGTAARAHPREYPICRMILSKASRDLRTFTVCLTNFLGDAPHVRDLALWDLEELERPWFRERFTLIETVVVQLSGIGGEVSIIGGNRGDFSSLEFMVLKMLPGLQAAGLLKVVQWNGDEEVSNKF